MFIQATLGIMQTVEAATRPFLLKTVDKQYIIRD